MEVFALNRIGAVTRQPGYNQIEALYRDLRAMTLSQDRRSDFEKRILTAFKKSAHLFELLKCAVIDFDVPTATLVADLHVKPNCVT